MAQQLIVPLEMEVLNSNRNLEKADLSVIGDEIKKVKFSDILKNFEGIIIKAFPSMMVMVFELIVYYPLGTLDFYINCEYVLFKGK